MAPSAQSRVGPLLREWRERRRVTQLELALDAGVSARHLSFVETGRSLPSREMVLRLAARLERERLAPSLRQFADEIDHPSGDLVVAALILAADKSPRRLGDLLGRLATAARAHVNMQLRVASGRARTQTAVRVITVFTTLFAIGLLIFNRDYLEPYDSLFGQFVLSIVGLLFGTAFVWLARAFRPVEEERFLRTEDVLA